MLGSVFAGLTAYIMDSSESVGTVFTAWKREKTTCLLLCIVLLLTALAFACQYDKLSKERILLQEMCPYYRPHTQHALISE